MLDDVVDIAHGIFDRRVLLHLGHSTSRADQGNVHLHVPFAVPYQLGSQVTRVRTRRAALQDVSVQEAPVCEPCHKGPCEHRIKTNPLPGITTLNSFLNYRHTPRSPDPSNSSDAVPGRRIARRRADGPRVGTRDSFDPGIGTASAPRSESLRLRSSIRKTPVDHHQLRSPEREHTSCR